MGRQVVRRNRIATFSGSQGSSLQLMKYPSARMEKYKNAPKLGHRMKLMIENQVRRRPRGAKSPSEKEMEGKR